MVKASLCTVELWMHLRDVLLSSQQLEEWFIDVTSLLNGNM